MGGLKFRVMTGLILGLLLNIALIFFNGSISFFLLSFENMLRISFSAAIFFIIIAFFIGLTVNVSYMGLCSIIRRPHVLNSMLSCQIGVLGSIIAFSALALSWFIYINMGSLDLGDTRSIVVFIFTCVATVVFGIFTARTYLKKTNLSNHTIIASSKRGENRIMAVFSILVVSGYILTCFIGTRGYTAQPYQWKNNGKKIVLIGIDGLEWDVVHRMIRQGELPNTATLIENGVSGDLLSLEPTLSPRLWTSIATGKVPEKHGILDFLDEDKVPVTSNMRKAKTIWNILSDFGHTVGVVGWYVTWPAEPVNGWLISDRADMYLNSFLRNIINYFFNISDGNLNRFGPIDFNPDYKKLDKKEEYYKQKVIDDRLWYIYIRDGFYALTAEYLFKKFDHQFFALYLRGPDYASHSFWQYMEPDGFSGIDTEDIEIFGKVIENYYIYIDEILGKLLQYIDNSTDVIIVSDHGFGARADRSGPIRNIGSSGAHKLNGVIIMKGVDFKKGEKISGASILDITPTILSLYGLPVAMDMDGKILKDAMIDKHSVYRKTRVVQSYDNEMKINVKAKQSVTDRQILDRLKTLGYIQ
jgi:predicted AlkP superfamily phosphohydrolase/phosphomutase